jgi:hypothetical protein
MALAALEALIAGVKVRCEVVERDGIVAKVFSPNGVDIGSSLVSAGRHTGGTRTRRQTAPLRDRIRVLRASLLQFLRKIIEHRTIETTHPEGVRIELRLWPYRCLHQWLQVDLL